VYATGEAVRSGHGVSELMLIPTRTLRPGRYALTTRARVHKRCVRPASGESARPQPRGTDPRVRARGRCPLLSGSRRAMAVSGGRCAC
jgi:hypothetical protein